MFLLFQSTCASLVAFLLVSFPTFVLSVRLPALIYKRTCCLTHVRKNVRGRRRRHHRARLREVVHVFLHAIYFAPGLPTESSERPNFLISVMRSPVLHTILASAHAFSCIGLFASIIMLCVAMLFMVGTTLCEVSLIFVAVGFALPHVLVASRHLVGRGRVAIVAQSAAREAAALGPQLCVILALADTPDHAFLWQNIVYLAAAVSFLAAVVACGFFPPKVRTAAERHSRRRAPHMRHTRVVHSHVCCDTMARFQQSSLEVSSSDGKHLSLGFEVWSAKLGSPRHVEGAPELGPLCSKVISHSTSTNARAVTGAPRL